MQRPYRDALADMQLRTATGAKRRDAPGQFVALHPRELRPASRVRQVSGKEVIVRAADPDCLGANHNVPRTGGSRFGALDHPHGTGALGDRGTHQTRPSPV